MQNRFIIWVGNRLRNLQLSGVLLNAPLFQHILPMLNPSLARLSLGLYYGNYLSTNDKKFKKALHVTPWYLFQKKEM